jgi:hypothetical protein
MADDNDMDVDQEVEDKADKVKETGPRKRFEVKKVKLR